MNFMRQENLDRIKKIISIILLIGWCLLIFYFSNQNGIISRYSSSRALNFLNKILNINLYNYKYSILIVRKCAHMFLYFILYLLVFIVFKNFKVKKIYFYSLIFCLIYAISDEVHQLFIVERSFKISDIFIDLGGSIINLIIIKIFHK